MKWKTFRKLTMIEQTLFGLPWALIGAILPFANEEFARHFHYGNWELWVWILLAFTTARTAGMSFNRLIDHHIDLANPRTAKRPLPAGEVTRRQVATIAWGALILFLVACGNINFLCFVFSLPVAFLIGAYSYTKRYTPACHFVLGMIEFFAPFLGWVAVTGSISAPPLFLGSAILLWISGMDIMYATQDYAFDKKMGLRSLPVVMGVSKSLFFAKLLHAGVVICLFIAGLLAGVSLLYYVGLSIVIALFFYQHRVVTKEINKAFFRANSLIAVTQFVATLGAVWTVSL